MRQLVRQEAYARRGGRLVAAGAEPDVVLQGCRGGPHAGGEPAGFGVGVDTHAREVVGEAGLHRASHALLEGGTRPAGQLGSPPRTPGSRRPDGWRNSNLLVSRAHRLPFRVTTTGKLAGPSCATPAWRGKGHSPRPTPRSGGAAARRGRSGWNGGPPRGPAPSRSWG